MAKSPRPTPPSPNAHLVLEAEAIERALKRVAHEILESNPDVSRLLLAGIPSRGVALAERLAGFISKVEGRPVATGVVDVSMHRDDLRRRGPLGDVQPTRLPLALDGITIVLVDDVLYTGRTCRAAMDAIASYGRPARIQLAALIDRGHRELPIRADFVGKNLPTSPAQRVYVRLEATDGLPDSVWIDFPPANP